MKILGEAVRAKRIEDELSAIEGVADLERITLPWKDENAKLFSVIHVPLDHVVLNPFSHRIKPYLESSPDRQKVYDDPYSEDAQEILAEVLRETEGFNDLKMNLRDYGQNDAGVVTRAGVLLNANTRAVALRDLGRDYIKAAVLPKNADPKDLAQLELKLQMRKDFKQDYTFTGQLLFIEDLKTELGYDDERVAREMNLAAGTDKTQLKKGVLRAQQMTRMLALIRELQARSEGAIPLNFFDDKNIALTELDGEYETARQRDPAGADQLREARILALLVGTQYRKIRRIDALTTANVVVPLLIEDEDVGSKVAAVMAINEDDRGSSALSELADDLPARDEPEGNLAALVDLVAKSHAQDRVTLPSDDGAAPTSVLRDEFVTKIGLVMEDAAAEVDRQNTATKNVQGPINLLRDARRNAQNALDAYQKAVSDPKFKKGNFNYELRHLGQVVEALKAETLKH